MITKLALENFRCFRDFSLEGIRPVTLIAGANNAGKSTVLESIFLFMDRNASEVFIKLNHFRGIAQWSPFSTMIWEPLFSGMDISKTIAISIDNNGEKQTVTISKDDSFLLSQILRAPLRQSAADFGPPISNAYPLKISYENQNENSVSHFVLTEAGVMLYSGKAVKAKTPRAQYMGPQIGMPPQYAAEWLSGIDLAGERGKCVEALKILEPRLKDLSVAVINGVNGIYAGIGLPKRLPVNMLGNGVNKLMQLALAMLAHPGSILLVDEIETGFHYSLFPKLWEIIGKLAGETGCQVFATTHSYECVSGAAGLAANDADSNLFRFIRLDQEDGVVVSHVFENDSFNYAVHNDWEVR